jgi:hypothetical protein
MSHTAASNNTNNSAIPALQPTFFYEHDLDLSKCSPLDLQLVTENRLLLRTPYPKLVAMLANDVFFSDWHAAKVEANSAKKIHFILDALSCYCCLLSPLRDSNDVRLGQVYVDTTDILFWKHIVHHTLRGSPYASKSVPDSKSVPETASHTLPEQVNDSDDHEYKVVQKVEHTMKPYRYWCKDNVQPSDSSRAQQPSTRKRNVWIS